MTSLTPARQPEIIRSHQKDDHYMGQIKSLLGDIAQRVLGPRNWIQWNKELDLAGDLGYLVLTTLAGNQTLGEEYVNMIQVNSSKRAVPGWMKRLTMAILQVIFPYGCDKFLAYVERHVQQNPHLRLNPQARARILRALPAIRYAITVIHRCHLAAFYWNGIFYHIAKRISGIHYLRITTQGAPVGNLSSYKLLSYLCTIQLAFTFLQHCYKVAMERHSSPRNASSSESVSPADQIEDDTMSALKKCPLCLETRKASTATPCGHVFCWECIHAWSQNKSACPLCRQSFQPSRLVFLQNYDV